MQSPLFREHFEKDSWTLLFFSALRQMYSKRRELTDISAIYNQPSKKVDWTTRESAQQELALSNKETD